MPRFEGEVRPLAGARYAILASRWNPRITDSLVDAACRAFSRNGVAEADIDVVRVPGAWELPVTANAMAATGAYAALVALGCVVRGETRHYEQVADDCASGLMRVSIDHRLPVANGVLAVEAHADAEARAGGKHGNKGEEAALVALEMAHLLHRISLHPIEEPSA